MDNMVQDPDCLNKIEKNINKIKAEATYFFEAGGKRIATFIVEVRSGPIPILAEPLFSGMGALCTMKFRKSNLVAYITVRFFISSSYCKQNGLRSDEEILNSAIADI
jgi:hypothetical protein